MTKVRTTALALLAVLVAAAVIDHAAAAAAKKADPYDVLGVPKKATLDEIRKAGLYKLTHHSLKWFHNP
jgi:preprotein translocase subunit Sec63